jgi:hypothetical protein
LDGFTATVLAENKPMLAIFPRSGLKLELELSHGAYELKARFEKRGNATGAGPD